MLLFPRENVYLSNEGEVKWNWATLEKWLGKMIYTKSKRFDFPLEWNDERNRERERTCEEMKIYEGEHLPAANMERVRRAGSTEWCLSLLGRSFRDDEEVLMIRLVLELTYWR
jgi:hypothetical protein